MSTGNVWFTSDPHYFHDKVAVMRGYENALEMNIALMNNWNRVVKPEDQVWILGDLCMSQVEETLNIISQLNGEKHLIWGNHDAGHPRHKHAFKQHKRYLQVFESVQDSARRTINGVDVLLNHFPYHADHTGIPRFDQWRLRDYGVWLLHGHTHGKTKVHTELHEIQVGVDAWNMTPVSINEIAKLLKEHA